MKITAVFEHKHLRLQACSHKQQQQSQRCLSQVWWKPCRLQQGLDWLSNCGRWKRDYIQLWVTSISIKGQNQDINWVWPCVNHDYRKLFLATKHLGNPWLMWLHKTLRRHSCVPGGRMLHRRCLVLTTGAVRKCCITRIVEFWTLVRTVQQKKGLLR